MRAIVNEGARVARGREAEAIGDAEDQIIGSTVLNGQTIPLPRYSAILPTRDFNGDIEQACLTAGAKRGQHQRDSAGRRDHPAYDQRGEGGARTVWLPKGRPLDAVFTARRHGWPAATICRSSARYAPSLSNLTQASTGRGSAAIADLENVRRIRGRPDGPHARLHERHLRRLCRPRRRMGNQLQRAGRAKSGELPEETLRPAAWRSTSKASVPTPSSAAGSSGWPGTLPPLRSAAATSSTSGSISARSAATWPRCEVNGDRTRANRLLDRFLSEELETGPAQYGRSSHRRPNKAGFGLHFYRCGPDSEMSRSARKTLL